MINREEMKKRAEANLEFGMGNRLYSMVWGGPNPILQVTVGKKSFCLCEEHFADFSYSVKRGENEFPISIPGSWAKNTKFTTQVMNGVCPICAN